MNCMQMAGKLLLKKLPLLLRSQQPQVTSVAKNAVNTSSIAKMAVFLKKLYTSTEIVLLIPV